ncbi:long-chain acyl-CoA synthetase [Dysgonomonas sp. PFB1-18]|uniref:AMP-binding protein n=1 Tax=unclassified Dysgonomonas TaxID=2630389 RepID=UPI002472F0E5|nr:MULTISPECIES: AMP-binding protein [unclassified Dysgonomonas]MDH6309759.1 long-chain acyl-CoA synthetase [Dysgonomonas sp. PF1-14]MDH6339233.1 long-chain acyl-CoA synthetase [Dysgonomonas sp. PF1-16]MDH6380732.1 long-chain acyl-CoA synthetase [Dysgonomonas sp. PFB1-18]MDH6398228.1 long-chain acyl-CoA synthetase [Dysgonomonas sp. PF1-23]
MVDKNLIELYENSFKYNWDLQGLSDYSEKKTLYYKDLAREIARIHILLSEAQVKKGDKVALIGKNNIPWCVTYLAVLTYGAVIVPILQDFHADSIQHIVNHSESKLMFASTQIWDSLDEDYLPAIRGVFSINSFKFSCLYEQKGERLSAIVESLDNKMAEKYPNGFTADDIKYAKVDNSELVLINYTSGTTGFSKGVMLSANNLAGNITHAHYLKLLFRGQNIVSFLPLAHAYGCAFEFLYSLTEGSHTTLLGKAPSPKILAEAFAEIKPHLIISVPLVIEKIYKKSILPKIEKPAIKMALKIPIVRDQIYAKIRKGMMEGLGGNFHEVIIGGAALNGEVEAFLHKIKFPFTVGYGMTECAPLVSYDHNYDFIPTSCGKVLDNIMEVRIDSEDPYNVVGEIQVRGENVMMGYYKNEEATKAAFTEDGWLKTGDLGTIDKDYRIFIRGRSKTMLLGPSGQNIFPEEIESKLNNMPFVLESLVVERNGKLVALTHPDYETMDAAHVDQEMLPAIMEQNRQNLNKMLSNYENISAIQIYPSEFEKTPKKSIKRYLYDN